MPCDVAACNWNDCESIMRLEPMSVTERIAITATNTPTRAIEFTGMCPQDLHCVCGPGIGAGVGVGSGMGAGVGSGSCMVFTIETDFAIARFGARFFATATFGLTVRAFVFEAVRARLGDLVADIDVPAPEKIHGWIEGTEKMNEKFLDSIAKICSSNNYSVDECISEEIFSPNAHPSATCQNTMSRYVFPSTSSSLDVGTTEVPIRNTPPHPPRSCWLSNKR